MDVRRVYCVDTTTLALETGPLPDHSDVLGACLRRPLDGQCLVGEIGTVVDLVISIWVTVVSVGVVVAMRWLGCVV